MEGQGLLSFFFFFFFNPHFFLFFFFFWSNIFLPFKDSSWCFSSCWHGARHYERHSCLFFRNSETTQMLGLTSDATRRHHRELFPCVRVQSHCFAPHFTRLLRHTPNHSGISFAWRDGNWCNYGVSLRFPSKSVMSVITSSINRLSDGRSEK